MKVNVHINDPGWAVNEEFAGDTPDVIVSAIRARIVRDLPIMLRIASAPMSDLQFIQETVRRYNAANGKTIPIPRSAAEFLEEAQRSGMATVEP